jgi:hypothetical protein
MDRHGEPGGDAGGRVGKGLADAVDVARVLVMAGALAVVLWEVLWQLSSDDEGSAPVEADPRAVAALEGLPEDPLFPERWTVRAPPRAVDPPTPGLTRIIVDGFRSDSPDGVVEEEPSPACLEIQDLPWSVAPNAGTAVIMDIEGRLDAGSVDDPQAQARLTIASFSSAPDAASLRAIEAAAYRCPGWRRGLVIHTTTASDPPRVGEASAHVILLRSQISFDDNEFRLRSQEGFRNEWLMSICGSYLVVVEVAGTRTGPSVSDAGEALLSAAVTALEACPPPLPDTGLSSTRPA